jgi:hypothetical protein
MKKGEKYRNRYTGEIVIVKAIESVHIGPGDRHVDVVVLEDGERWQVGRAPAQFSACHDPAKS